MKRPCGWCQKMLAVQFDTDNGELVEMTEPCDCKDACWRRGECVEPGCPVTGLRRGTRLGRMRCPKHHEKNERERKRRHQPRYYRRHRDRINARRRARWWLDDEWREHRKREFRRRYRIESRIRKRRRQLPPRIRALRDRLIYRLREDQGWSFVAIGRTIGLSGGHAGKMYQQESERRQMRRAA